MSRPASWGWERWPQRKTLDGVTYLCRWCAKSLTGNATSYCSNQCQYEIEVRCNWSVLASAIFERDGRICQNCRVNLDDLEEFFKWYRRLFQKYSGASDSRMWGSVAQTQQWPFPDSLTRDLGYAYDHLWEINHKVALSEGGDPVDPQNLETLCVPCHKKHTAALRKRLKEKKKK